MQLIRLLSIIQDKVKRKHRKERKGNLQKTWLDTCPRCNKETEHKQDFIQDLPGESPVLPAIGNLPVWQEPDLLPVKKCLECGYQYKNYDENLYDYELNDKGYYDSYITKADGVRRKF